METMPPTLPQYDCECFHAAVFFSSLLTSQIHMVPTNHYRHVWHVINVQEFCWNTSELLQFRCLYDKIIYQWCKQVQTREKCNLIFDIIQNSLSSDSPLDSGKEGRRINNVCNCVGAKLKENHALTALYCNLYWTGTWILCLYMNTETLVTNRSS